MASIRVMSDALASQVAAGEVIERPASVVKELLENSLDAGAGRIDAMIERGGAALVRVIDDGSGMSREDALLSVERHATSKLRVAADLQRVQTFGFRGEALPSIASVARFRLATRESNALAGTEILIDGGKLRDVRDCGDAPGTAVEVRGLFFNVPARRKFLRAESTEFAHIESAVRVAAIARPDVAFSLHHNGRPVLRLPGASTRLERIADLAGRQVADALVELQRAEGRGGLAVEGWIARPGFVRRSRSLQYVFLNGRPIDTGAVSEGLRAGYAGLVERGQHPPVFLFITCDPAAVDVNVHPAKREVRFRDHRALRDLVGDCIAAALRAASLSPGRRSEGGDAVAAGDDAPAMTPVEPIAPPSTPRLHEAVSAPAAPTEASETVPGSSAAARYRVLGTLGRRYAVLESDDGLVLMHRRGVHQRILFEEMLRARGESGAVGQALLMAETLELAPGEFEVAAANLEGLRRLGVGVETFGASTVKIDALPAAFADMNPGEFVAGLVADMVERGDRAGIPDEQLATLASGRASRSGEAESVAEIESLLSRLFDCDVPFVDPFGRPTLVQFSHRELARRFELER